MKLLFLQLLLGNIILITTKRKLIVTQEKKSKINKFIPLYDKYMIFAGILGQYLFYAQAYKIFTTKSANDLSFDGFIVIVVSALSWLIYGILHKSFPLIITNIAALIGMFLVIAGILIHAT